MIKKFAILTEVGYQKYLHIKSQQEMHVLGSCFSTIGDYTVNNVEKFAEKSKIYIRNNNFTPKTKVSLNFIVDYEDNINKLLDPAQEIVELFK
ncbi:MAG: hypothetical protein J6Q13_02205 [Clostridia bacterium]|nr:hypothetical protein [Clostridia bacterium]